MSEQARLGDFPQIMDEITSIYKNISADEFEYLCKTERASPSSAIEYRNALRGLLGRGKLTDIPAATLAEAAVLSIKDAPGSYSIDVQFYVNGEPSDIYGIFKAAPQKVPLKHSVFLYDILMP